MRIAKFAAVGVVNTAVDFAVFNTVLFGMHGTPFVAKISAGVIGTINSFVLNRRYTFADRTSDRWHGELARFVVAMAVGMGVNAITVLVAIKGVHAVPALSELPRQITYNGANALGVVTGFVWNYLSSHHFVFVGTRER